MARRRKSYAGTVFEHRSQAKHLVPELRSWEREFKAVIGHRGATYGRKCHEALGLLVGAARVQARYDQERAWAHGHRRGARTGSQRAIRGMQRKFYQTCVVSPR